MLRQAQHERLSSKVGTQYIVPLPVRPELVEGRTGAVSLTPHRRTVSYRPPPGPRTRAPAGRWEYRAVQGAGAAPILAHKQSPGEKAVQETGPGIRPI